MSDLYLTPVIPSVKVPAQANFPERDYRNPRQINEIIFSSQRKIAQSAYIIQAQSFIRLTSVKYRSIKSKLDPGTVMDTNTGDHPIYGGKISIDMRSSIIKLDNEFVRMIIR